MTFSIVSDPVDTIKNAIPELFESAVIRHVEFRGELTLWVKPEFIVEMCRTLRETAELNFNYLSDLTAVDHLKEMKEGEPRFEVVYNLFSTRTKKRVRLKAAAWGDPPAIRSVTPVWVGANWHERECYDMFGIVFEGHPDLRRILMPEDWEGYPLRKDYPYASQEPYEYLKKQLADE
jgi:NADH-quinone oxidoreductase subunit C